MCKCVCATTCTCTLYIRVWTHTGNYGFVVKWAFCSNLVKYSHTCSCQVTSLPPPPLPGNYINFVQIGPFSQVMSLISSNIPNPSPAPPTVPHRSVSSSELHVMRVGTGGGGSRSTSYHSSTLPLRKHRNRVSTEEKNKKVCLMSSSRLSKLTLRCLKCCVTLG